MNPDTSAILKPYRGRPPKVDCQPDDTCQTLIRLDLEVLTETSYPVIDIEAIVRNIDVPKGSSYHCFKSEGTFDLAVLSAYGDFFAYKLDKSLLGNAVPPLERMAVFVRHADQGMERYQFRHDCLMGNLLQGTPLLLDTFPGRLKAILTVWEPRVARYLRETQAAGTIARDASPDTLAQVFWTGREGAVICVRLRQSAASLD